MLLNVNICVEPQICGDLGPRYLIKEKIGEGSYGQVYEVVSYPYGTKYVAKFIEKPHPIQFQNEITSLKKLRKHRGFPKFIDSGTSDQFMTGLLPIKHGSKFIILEKLGQSLLQVLQKGKRYIKKHDALKIGIQILQLLSSIHSEGILHLDIKPDNILLEHDLPVYDHHPRISLDGLSDLETQEKAQRLLNHTNNEPNSLWFPMQLYIVDFGLIKTYLDKDKQHLPNTHKQNLKGNFIFASKWAFTGHRMSRRDDVCMLLYNLIWMLDPQNSWLSQISSMQSMEQARKEIKQKKILFHPIQVCSTDRTQFLTEFCEEIYSYQYDEEPNYNKLKFMLEKELLNEYCLPDKIFSFLQKTNFIGQWVISEYKMTGNEIDTSHELAPDEDDEEDINEIRESPECQIGYEMFQAAKSNNFN